MSYDKRTEKYGIIKRTDHNENAYENGPWDKEPDYVEWITDCGLKAVIRRVNLGTLCGYAVFDMCEKEYYSSFNLDDLYMDCHGGPTYFDRMIPGQQRCEENVVVVGFDCAHYGDLIPSLQSILKADVSEYKNIEFVRNECERLAKIMKDVFPGALIGEQKNEP
jgi:hypothetical protein